MNDLLIVLLVAVCIQAVFFFIEKILDKIKIHPEYRLFTYQVSQFFIIFLPLLLWLSQKESKIIKLVATPISTRQVSAVTQIIKNSSISFSSYLPQFYFFITAILLLRLTSHYRKARRTLQDLESINIFDQKVYLTDTSSPFCFGLLKPKIYWPKKFDLSEDLKEVAFTHEYHHQMNRDPLWILINRVMNAFMWMSPLTYLINRRFPLIIEERCDAQTLESSKISAKDYGSFLLNVEISQNLNNSFFVHFNQSDLRRRIMSMKFNTIKLKNFKLTILILTSFLGLNIMAIGYSSQNIEKSHHIPIYDLNTTITIDNIEYLNSRVILRENTQGVIDMTSAENPFLLRIKASADSLQKTDNSEIVIEMAMKTGNDITGFKAFPKIYALRNQNGHLNYLDDEGRMIDIDYIIKEKTPHK